MNSFGIRDGLALDDCGGKIELDRNMQAFAPDVIPLVRFARWSLVEHDAYDEGGIIAATGPF